MEEHKSYTILNSVALQHTKIELRDDGIIQFLYGDHVHYTLDEAQEIEDVVKEITNGAVYRSLRITGKYSSTDIDIMKYLSRGRGILFTLADAFVIHSLPQKILGNFYTKVQKPYVPTNFFNQLDLAETWLKSLDQPELENIHKLNCKRIE